MLAKIRQLSENMFRTASITNTICLCVTLVLVVALQPTSAIACIILAGWLTFPYMVVSLSLAVIRRNSKARHICYPAAVPVIALLNGFVGIGTIAYIMFVAPDAQGAIGIMLTPVYQMILLSIGLLVTAIRK